MTFLLDTNVVSETVKPRPARPVDDWLAGCLATDLYLSAITLGEIVRGARRLRDEGRRRAYEVWIERQLLRDFRGRILPFDVEAATIWGEILAAGDRAGLTLPAVDAQIAALARRHGMTVVTRNVRDFSLMNVTLLNPWSEQGG